jgi:hypothetical protein
MHRRDLQPNRLQQDFRIPSRARRVRHLRRERVEMPQSQRNPTQDSFRVCTTSLIQSGLIFANHIFMTIVTRKIRGTTVSFRDLDFR